MGELKDKYGREINYIRVSITDRCNLNCLYCKPSGGIELLPRQTLPSFEEIVAVLEAAAELGIKKVRLTGGEPLIRRGLPELVGAIKAIEGIEDLSITTNGLLLSKMASTLAAQGLNRVNVSVDSFFHDRFFRITGGGDLKTVLKGIESAKDTGLTPIKLNMVPMRGINDDEIESFARLTMAEQYQVRFIELMPTALKSHSLGVSWDEIKSRIEQISPLTPLKLHKQGPARYFTLDGAKGVVGIIAAMTCRFCSECNRLRLTADGKLMPCLFSGVNVPLIRYLREGATKEEIKTAIKVGIELKPEGHKLFRPDSGLSPDENGPESDYPVSMSRIGG